MKLKFDLALMAMRKGYARIAMALLKDALSLANVECPQAKPVIFRAMNYARRMPRV